MVLMPFTDFIDSDKKLLKAVARNAICTGLEKKGRQATAPEDFPLALRQMLACFVTLNIDERLRGCIGSLQAIRPLVEDVAANAYAAAFSDPRFPALMQSEMESISIHISVLSKAEPLIVASEGELLQQLRPGVDGLILEEGARRATFLPSVWEQLPEPQEFFTQLKLKAGLPVGYWSDTISLQMYSVIVVE